MDGAIHYRIVGEYEEEESMRYELPFEQSEQPLTLTELIDLIDGACHPEPYCPGGILTSNWTAMKDMGYEAGEIIGFLSLSSPSTRSWAPATRPWVSNGLRKTGRLNMKRVRRSPRKIKSCLRTSEGNLPSA